MARKGARLDEKPVKRSVVYKFQPTNKTTLGSVLLCCKEWYTLLQDESTWKKMALYRFPALNYFPFQFTKESDDDTWEHFYVQRLDRDRKPIRQLKESFDLLLKTESQSDFSSFIEQANQVKECGEVAGFFPNKYTDKELAFLADSIIYSRVMVSIQHDTGYKWNEMHHYEIGGKIIGLDGKQHDFSFSFKYHWAGDERYEDIHPKLTVGTKAISGISFRPVEGEIQETLNVFISEVRESLAVQETKYKDLFEFLSAYMIPNAFSEDKEELWGEIEEVLEGKLEEPAMCAACQGSGATLTCCGCDVVYHKKCLDREVNEEEEDFLCKQCEEENK